jgi:hypothetical protein
MILFLGDAAFIENPPVRIGDDTQDEPHAQ